MERECDGSLPVTDDLVAQRHAAAVQLQRSAVRCNALVCRRQVEDSRLGFLIKRHKAADRIDRFDLTATIDECHVVGDRISRPFDVMTASVTTSEIAGR